MKKLLNSTPALRSTNNVLFGLSMLSLFAMMFAGIQEQKSAAQQFAQSAAFFTWFGFLSLWVLSMLIGFVVNLLKKESRLLLQVLRVSCAAGILHLAVLPAVFLVR